LTSRRISYGKYLLVEELETERSRFLNETVEVIVKVKERGKRTYGRPRVMDRRGPSRRPPAVGLPTHTIEFAKFDVRPLALRPKLERGMMPRATAVV
jgi:hypothetical protein